jgi:signal transduction histidine kinase
MPNRLPFHRLISYWLPKTEFSDHYALPRCRLVILVTYVLLAINLMSGVWTLLTGITQVPLLVFFLALVVILLSCKYASRAWVPPLVFQVTTLAMLLLLIVSFKEISYATLCFVPCYIMLGLYLTGNIYGLVWALLCLVSCAATIFLRHEISFPSFMIPERFLDAAVVVEMGFAALATYIVTIIFIRYVEHLKNDLALRNMELARQNSIIEAGHREKEMLISIVCHDIASPLSNIFYHLDRPWQGDESSELEARIAKMRQSSENIQQIIKNVSRYQTLLMGKQDIHIGCVSLKAALQNTLHIFDEQLKGKHMTVQTEWETAEDIRVCADEILLSESVLGNLISNAIKFSDPGQTIMIRGFSRDETVFLSISDYGIGIPEHLVKKLFRTDVVTTRAGTKGETGTGMGLPIVSSCMHKFGGNVDVY